MAETTREERDRHRASAAKGMGTRDPEKYLCSVAVGFLLRLLTDADKLAAIEGDYDCPVMCCFSDPCVGCKAAEDRESLEVLKDLRARQIPTLGNSGSCHACGTLTSARCANVKHSAWVCPEHVSDDGACFKCHNHGFKTAS